MDTNWNFRIEEEGINKFVCVFVKSETWTSDWEFYLHKDGFLEPTLVGRDNYKILYFNCIKEAIQKGKTVLLKLIENDRIDLVSVNKQIKEDSLSLQSEITNGS